MSDSLAFQIVQDLWRKNRNFCSTDYDASLDYLTKIIPFRIDRFSSEEPYNGWVIPPKWDLISGRIYHQGRIVFEVQHPLQIISLSLPFHETVSLQELKKHLHYDQRDPEATPYHFRQSYRPWERDWGFCVSKQFFDSLKPGNYEVEIITREEPGYLDVAEYTVHGSLPETFVFVAHLDHPGMANDDLAGVAVGVELFRRLASRHLKYSYRLVLVQEIIGSVFYLGKQPKSRQNIMEACFLEMLGTETDFALQSSRRESTRLEHELKKTMEKNALNFRKGPFRSIICNDESVWESYNIPMSSFSRYPYSGYHSNKDNLSIISPQALEQSIDILWETIQRLDHLTLMRKKFEGVPAVAHPAFDLYVDPGQAAFGSLASEKINKLRFLMDAIPMPPEVKFVETLAEEADMPIDEVLSYLKKWEKKSLIELS